MTNVTAGISSHVIAKRESRSLAIWSYRANRAEAALLAAAEGNRTALGDPVVSPVQLAALEESASRLRSVSYEKESALNTAELAVRAQVVQMRADVIERMEQMRAAATHTDARWSNPEVYLEYYKLSGERSELEKRLEEIDAAREAAVHRSMKFELERRARFAERLRVAINDRHLAYQCVREWEDRALGRTRGDDGLTFSEIGEALRIAERCARWHEKCVEILTALHEAASARLARFEAESARLISIARLRSVATIPSERKLAVVAAWGGGSRTIDALRAVIRSSDSTATALEDWLSALYVATNSGDDDEALRTFGAVPNDVNNAVYALTGSEDWTR